MQIHNVQQGTPEWLALRKDFFTASEAPAMMGVSKYKTREQLLFEKKTGITQEVDAATQARFDEGHKTEDMARSILENRMQGDLYPVTCTEGKYLASVDGLSMCGKYAFEHKLFNKLFAEQVENGIVPETHIWQLEQVLLVTGAESILFVVSDGTKEKWAEISYSSDPEKRRALIAGWEQFEKDLEEYEPPKATEKVEAAPIKELPAITYQMNGLSLTSNLEKFRAQAEELIEQSKLPMATDQDFADRDALCKMFKTAEDKIKVIQEQALGEIEDVAAFSKELGHISELIRQARLSGEKQVKARKEEIKLEILNEAKEKIQNHILATNNTLEGVSLPSFGIDIAGAMKGKKTVQSLQEAANDEVAKAKIEINAMADEIRLNLKSLEEHASEYKFLFADLQQIVTRDNTSFVSEVKVRVMEHKEAEAKRIAAEKEREAQQEQERIERENMNKELSEAQEQQAQEASEAHAPKTEAPVNYQSAQKTPFEQWWHSTGKHIQRLPVEDWAIHLEHVAEEAFRAGMQASHSTKAA